MSHLSRSTARRRRPAESPAARSERPTLSKRDALIEQYAWHGPQRPGLVGSIAQQVLLQLPPCFDLEELAAAGNLGLLLAATRYAPGKHGGVPFSAYARFRIRGAMLDSVRRSQWNQATSDPLPEFDREWEITGPRDTRRELAQFVIPCTIDADIDKRRLVERVNQAIARLPERQARVLRTFYDGARPTAATLAAALGVKGYEAERERAEAVVELRRLLDAAG